VTGSGFPQESDLSVASGDGQIVPKEAVQVLINVAEFGGAYKAIQGYDRFVRIISENALEVCLPHLI
jgi:hypothetical protein